MNSEELKQALAAPFPDAMLKQLSKGGRNFTYIPGPEVVMRLNSALGIGQWSYQVVSHSVVEDQVVVLGELTVNLLGMEATYQQFGGQALKRYSKGDNEGKPLDYADDLKGAATDALKKCAQMLGVGIDLARKEEALRYEAQQEARANQRVTCPAGDCPVEGTRAELRPHLVGDHGWVITPDGGVVRPVSPALAEPAAEAPEARRSPAEATNQSEGPETQTEQAEVNPDQHLVNTLCSLSAPQTRAWLDFRNKAKLPAEVSDFDAEGKEAAQQFLTQLVAQQ